MANQKVRCSVEQLLCLEILLLPAKYKESMILNLNDIIVASVLVPAAEIRDHETSLVSGPFSWFQSRQIFHETHETGKHYIKRKKRRCEPYICTYIEAIN